MRVGGAPGVLGIVRVGGVLGLEEVVGVDGSSSSVFERDCGSWGSG